ncbi:TIGR03032 family protein [Pedosphaera parvula]|uniref:TPR repeat-containing protein n=1 Tax=Pedosphaera parvula (strain Ellin514) TaxID=320771 RepID=B9XMD5_PEDPL|nr:TIGR03032 family protein [Pedosphaera parvula]EEF58977.1 TPR repeat-containing protein [Pedosphaera parvula Ellin514]
MNSPMEYRDIRCAHSDSLPALLAQLRLSVLISTYQTGHLVVVSAREGRLTLTFNQFERAMGIAVKSGTIAVCTRKEVWFLRNAPDIAAKLKGHHDACFLARTSHFTDDIRAHEAAWVAAPSGGSEFWTVNTLFSCLSALHPHYSFAPRWKPPFISTLRPEDRCHLNGLAVVNGAPRYVTALGETDTPSGWRGVKQNGGFLMEVPSGRMLTRGLSLPHSPRVEGNQIFFLHSGQGELAVADSQSGQVTSVAHVPGVSRGLAIHGGYAFVGLSKARPSLEGLPIMADRDKLRCGLWVVDLRTGAIAGHLEFCTGIEEIFDVQVLPGIVSPYISGPAAEKDVGQPLWTIPPGSA